MNIIILSILMAIAVIAVSVRYITAKAREIDKEFKEEEIWLNWLNQKNIWQYAPN